MSSEPWTPPNAEFPPPRAGEPELFRAARVGDHDAIRAAIAAGEEIDQLFDLALDPDADESFATPLMVAAGSGDGATVETVRLLIDLGANPNREVDGESAATFAVRGLGWNYAPGGDADRLRAVLHAGCALDPASDRSAALVCAAAAAGGPELLAVLLEHGSGPHPAWSGQKGIQRAASYKEMYRDIKAHAAGDESSEDSTFAADAQEIMDTWDLEELARVQAAPYADEIPLFCAAASGSAECVQLLLEAGADVMLRDSSRRTALFEAASPAVARLLVARGLRMDDTDCYGWVPLSNAVSEGEEGLSTIKALVAAGADVNATHDHGYTVFMSAVGSGRHPSVLRLLIESGADPHAVSEYGYNAFHAAIDVDFGANAEESVRDTLGYLRDLGVDIEHRNHRGQSPLGRAIDDGTSLEVKVLCDLGANPNAPTSYLKCCDGTCERTESLPLFAAAGTAVDADEKVDALLQAGADPLATDAEGHTALVRAVAKLCQDAEDYPGMFKRFFSELSELRGPPDLDRSNRPVYLAQVTGPMTSFVTEFASEIPVNAESQYAQEWRAELIGTIWRLAAHEGWARWQVRQQRNGEDPAG